MIAQYEGVLGDGGGKGRVLWEEVIVCRGQDNDGGNGGATGSSGAWSKARDRGVVKVVSWSGQGTGKGGACFPLFTATLTGAYHCIACMRTVG